MKEEALAHWGLLRQINKQNLSSLTVNTRFAVFHTDLNVFFQLIMFNTVFIILTISDYFHIPRSMIGLFLEALCALCEIQTESYIRI